MCLFVYSVSVFSPKYSSYTLHYNAMFCNLTQLYLCSLLFFFFRFQVTYDRDGVKTTVTKTIITDGGRGGPWIDQ